MHIVSFCICIRCCLRTLVRQSVVKRPVCFYGFLSSSERCSLTPVFESTFLSCSLSDRTTRWSYSILHCWETFRWEQNLEVSYMTVSCTCSNAGSSLSQMKSLCPYQVLTMNPEAFIWKNNLQGLTLKIFSKVCLSHLPTDTATVWAFICPTLGTFARMKKYDTDSSAWNRRWRGLHTAGFHYRCWKFKYLIPNANTLAKRTVNTTGMATTNPIMSLWYPNVEEMKSLTITGAPPPNGATKDVTSPNWVAIKP